MTPTPSPDPARYVSPVCRDGSHQACANFRGTCRCTCHAAAVEGTERPGGWVDGIGWVALLADLNGDDLAAVHPGGQSCRAGGVWASSAHPVVVVRWADGTTPAPPAPSTPAPQPNARLRSAEELLRLTLDRAQLDGWRPAWFDNYVIPFLTVPPLAASPSAPVERPQPDEDSTDA